MKKKTKTYLYYLLIASFLWLWGTNIAQTLKCPEMTQTQLFLHLPQSFVLDFKDC